jgi:hypothetical protein
VGAISLLGHLASGGWAFITSGTGSCSASR